MTTPTDAHPHSALRDIPFLTPDIPGVGGAIKQRNEDFLVEEIPLYDPCGQGEHVYLLVEKNGLPASDLIRIIAKHFRVRNNAVGYAGMKDKDAVTRQLVSIHTPGKTPDDFPSLEHERIKVLWADLHTNKLRLGHLKGNRFSIRIRDVQPTRVLDAHRVIKRLLARGVPNLFGTQRFGHNQNNHEIGRLLLLERHRDFLDLFLGPNDRPEDASAEMRSLYAQGDFAAAAAATPHVLRHEIIALRALARGDDPGDVACAIPRIQTRFWFSAFQSALFNEIAAQRTSDDTLATLFPGDIAHKTINGALFDVDERTALDPDTKERLERLEISPSGPLWGPKMKRAGADIDAAELAALRRTDVTEDAIADAARAFDVSLPGSRRPLRVPLIDPDVEGGVDDHGPFIRVAFELPPGSFATVVLREIMKNDAPEQDGAD